MRSRRSTPKPRCKGARLRVLDQKGITTTLLSFCCIPKGALTLNPVRANSIPLKAIDPAQRRPASNDVNSRETYVIKGFAVNDFGEIWIIHRFGFAKMNLTIQRAIESTAQRR